MKGPCALGPFVGLMKVRNRACLCRASEISLPQE